MAQARIPDNKKRDIFLSLSTLPPYEAGVKHNLIQFYKDPRNLQRKVVNVYREVSQNPGKYGIRQEIADVVIEAMDKPKPSVVDKVKGLDKEDVKQLLTGSRNKILKLINKKLDMLGENEKSLEREKLVAMGTVFGILFDKAQIIQGEATEHVAHLSKIDVSSLKPGEAIEMVLKLREVQREE